MEVTNLFSPLKYVLLFIVLVLVQVLVCNNILLFGVAIPFVFIYFIISAPINVSLNLMLVLSFLLGMMIDLFSDTMGLNCLACLLLCALRKPVFYAYVPRDDKFLSTVPCISNVGWSNYLKYILTMSAIFCILVFGIELFGFASFGRIAAMAASSTLFTMLLLLATDAIVNK